MHFGCPSEQKSRRRNVFCGKKEKKKSKDKAQRKYFFMERNKKKTVKGNIILHLFWVQILKFCKKRNKKSYDSTLGGTFQKEKWFTFTAEAKISEI